MDRVVMRTTLLVALGVLAAARASAAQVEAGFSPDGGAERIVEIAIGAARTEILVAAYSFTSKPIAGALVSAQRRGVAVRVVLDASQAREHYNAATFLAHAGVPVRIDHQHAIMHNKYLVIDGRFVETGSFNYTTAAARHNAENAIIVDDERLAHQFAEDWSNHWAHSVPYQR